MARSKIHGDGWGRGDSYSVTQSIQVGGKWQVMGLGEEIFVMITGSRVGSIMQGGTRIQSKSVWIHFFTSELSYSLRFALLFCGVDQ